MTILEIIELRSHASLRSRLEAELCRLAEEANASEGPERLDVYTHGVVETDFSVHITWRTQQPADGSATGLRLMRSLREYGLVNHSIWIRQSPQENANEQR